MKTQTVLLLLLFTFTASCFGQAEQTLIPDFTPPSPEAFKMTRYGEMPIDEFNGKVKLDISLYNYKAGNLQLPIALNYYGAGVKVDDLPTQVGINWSLQAGGVITREIRDKVDETSNRPNLTDQQANDLNNRDCTPEARQLIHYLLTSNNDNQSDIFRFNFLNYSGSFYLDDSLRPVLVKNDQNLKIEIIGSLATSKTFRITDPNGVMYYFGGSQASEETYSRIVTGPDQNFTAQGTTSFYLYEIKDPINGRIFFTYDSLAQYFIDLGKSYTLTRSLPGGWGHCPSVTPDIKMLTLTKMSINGNKLLKKIYSENNKTVVFFNRTMVDNDAFKSYLNSIEVKKLASPSDLDGILISKSEFEYLGMENPAGAARFFLKRVVIDRALQNGDLHVNKKYQEYRMEYDRPETLPDRFSPKIDMLGYYNGSNNQDLYPCVPDASGGYAVGCPKRDADINYSKRGTLTKIYYPTGGFTNFEYEPQPGIVSGTQTITGEGHFFLGGQSQELTGEVASVPDIAATATIFITCSDYNAWGNHWAKFEVKITDLTASPNTVKREYASNGSKTFRHVFIPGHSYKIQYELILPTSSTINGYGAEGYFSISYPNSQIPTEGAGVRIKRIDNVADRDASESKRRFYYKPYHKIGLIGADLFSFIPRQNMSNTVIPCYLGPPGAMSAQKTQTFYSDYIISDYNCSAVKYKEYSTVTVSFGGDNFEQGGIEKTFKISEETGYFVLEPITPRLVEVYQNDYPNSKHNTVSLDGLLLKEKAFSNINGSIYKISEKKYEYDFPLLTRKTNLFCNEIFTFPALGDEWEHRYSMTISYTHNGFFDCLNPNNTNRCNCLQCGSYNTRIRNFMKARLRERLVSENSPLLADFNANFDSGLWDLVYTFNGSSTEATIALKERIGSCKNDNTLSNRFIGGYYTSSFDFKKTFEKETTYIDPIPATVVPAEYIDGMPSDYLTQEQLEASYKKITKSQSFEYGSLKGLPKKITTETSENGVFKVEKKYYANEATAIGGLSPSQITACNTLVAQNRIALPIQIEHYENSNLLNTNRTLYKEWNNNPASVLPEFIQTAKGSAPLEDRVVFTSYTNNGNPEIVSLKNGTYTKYFYHSNNKIWIKINNYILPVTNQTTQAIPTDDCSIIKSFPQSMVTVYNYDNDTDQITSITGPDCRKTFYVYDEMHNLRFIKDDSLQIIQEFSNNYRQN